MCYLLCPLLEDSPFRGFGAGGGVGTRSVRSERQVSVAVLPGRCTPTPWGKQRKTAFRTPYGFLKSMSLGRFHYLWIYFMLVTCYKRKHWGKGAKEQRSYWRKEGAGGRVFQAEGQAV